MTETEQRLWRALRELEGSNRFRRQHPIGRYIVDFACPSARLAIEIDGGQHAMICEVDDVRSSEIADHGYRVIRFWNSEVMENLEGVLQIICDELRLVPSMLAKKPPHPPHR
jgi:very-short-patch-repair endonuclease